MSIQITRREHILRRGKQFSLPRLVIYVDTETKLVPFTKGKVFHKFRLGCATFIDYTGRLKSDSIVFFNPLEFWEWALSKHYNQQKLYIFAHNAEFDFRVLQGFTLSKKLGYYIHFLVSEGNKFNLTLGNYKKEYNPDSVLEKIEIATDKEFKKKYPKISNYKLTTPKELRKTVDIVSSTNFFQNFTVKKLGELLNLPKLTIDFNEADDESTIAYCKRDVEILQGTMENYFNFIRTNNMGTFKSTIASQALTAFITTYMEHDIHIHNNVQAIELERKSYYGGRTEAYYIGKCPSDTYYYLDVNSMYLSAMMESLLPTKLILSSNIIPTNKMKEYIKNHIVIANYDVKTKHPCLPYRYENKLCFPIGEFNTTLCQPEIELAIKNRVELTRNETNIYECEYIFKKYAKYIWEIRRQYQIDCNKLYDTISKLFGNALYGKFGQCTEIWDVYENTNELITECFEIWDSETLQPIKYKAINGDIIKCVGKIESHDTMVAIASFITSNCRVKLYEYQVIAGRENVFYSDTDSVIVNSKGYHNLKKYICKEKLGYLKLEKQDTYFFINTLKDYIFGEDITLKGVKQKTNISLPNPLNLNKKIITIIDKYRNKKISYQELNKQLENAKYSTQLIRDLLSNYSTQNWEKLNSGIRNNRLETVIISDVDKHLTRDYNKGDVNSNGRVKPLVLSLDRGE